MKTLIWYRPILRWKIIEKLKNAGHTELAKQQEEYFSQEKLRSKMASLGRQIPSCIDSFDKDHFGLNTKVIFRIPPDEKTEELPDLITRLDRAAKKICLLNRPIDVLWSGGLDSTTSLLLLRRYAEKDQLSVILSEGSIDENPTLYKTLVRYMPHKINRNKNFRSEIEKDKITVNSNVADMNYAMQTRSSFHAGTINEGFVFKFKAYTRWRYGLYNVNMRDFGGIVFDEVLLEKSEFKEQTRFIPHCQSLYSDWDVMKWFINRQLKREVPFKPIDENVFINNNSFSGPTGSFKKQKEIWRQLPVEDRLDPSNVIIPITPYINIKMELRDFIAKESGDKDYAYGKDDGDSYSHGQIDVFLDKNINPLGLQSLNVAVCDNGDIIRRDQLEDIDPFDFITP